MGRGRRRRGRDSERIASVKRDNSRTGCVGRAPSRTHASLEEDIRASLDPWRCTRTGVAAMASNLLRAGRAGATSMRRTAVRAAMGCALIAGLALELSTGGREAPDFSGSWVRDQRASEDPVEKAKDQNVQAGAPRRRPFGISFPGGVWYP